MGLLGRLIDRADKRIPLAIRRLYIRRKRRDELFEYWRSPYDGKNMPSEYLKGRERSIFLVELVRRYIEKGDKILEIGCNVGRNLNELFCAGFKDLSGIEISRDAVEMMRVAYPEMAEAVKIFNLPVEEAIQSFEDGFFDLVFTMAVLEHIHTESEFIFPHIARVTRKILITIEDERGLSWRHFPRNYKRVFGDLGLRQVEEVHFDGIKIPGLTRDFVCRVFRK